MLGPSALRSSSGRLRPESPMPVLTQPGHSTDTPIVEPIIVRSRLSVSDMVTTPCFDTLYAPINGLDVTPAIDAVLTTWPGSPPAIMRGTNDRMPWITPQRFTPRTHAQSFS